VSGFLLDTNIPSETLRPLPAAKVAAWLERQTKESQFLSVVTIGELRRGTTLLAPGARRTQLERFIEITVPLWFGPRVLPVTQAIAESWGVLDAQQQSAGRPLGVTDGMIAASALEHGLTIVTRNVRDFEGLGVTIFNPWEEKSPR
jgi:predicted nucleic acid-binding protein